MQFNNVMSDIPGSILTPSQRKFLRGINLDKKEDSAKSMARSRIVERIQASYTDDIPLIARSMVSNTGYNSLDLKEIVDVSESEAFVEGLCVQVAVIRELALAAGEDPQEIIDEGIERGLATAEDRIVAKAKNNPSDLTFTEAKILAQFLPDESEKGVSATMEELEAALQDVADALEKTKVKNTGRRATVREDVLTDIVEELPNSDPDQ